MDLSVIIPAYNVEHLIGETLQSIIRQEVVPYEVIVVDDGSTDGTRETVKAYTGHINIKLVSTENNGQGCARNEGAFRASGDYIYFLDADDLMADNLVSRLAYAVEKDGYPELIMFAGEAFLEADVPVNAYEEYYRGFQASNVSGCEIIGYMGRYERFDGVPLVGLYIVKRSFWSDSNLHFRRIFYEDVEILPSVLMASSCVSVIDEKLFRRRIRNNSTTQSPETLFYLNSYIEVALTYSGKLSSCNIKDACFKRFFVKHIVWFCRDYMRVAMVKKQRLEYKKLMLVICRTKSAKVFKEVVCDMVSYKLSFVLKNKNNVV